MRRTGLDPQALDDGVHDPPAYHADGLLDFPQALLPDDVGLIVADAYDAEIIRPAATRPLAAARRKSETQRLAGLALRRLNLLQDPPPPDEVY